MKKNLLLIIAPVVILVGMLISGYKLTNPNSMPAEKARLVKFSGEHQSDNTSDKEWVNMNKTSRSAGLYTNTETTQHLIDYALSLIGSPYEYAGITPSGFDCSGFVTHVFDNYNLDIPHSSALQADEGVPVNKAEAAPGDLVIFTGTDEQIRKPGHVGIVISEPGDTITFVHSSSNGGVKVSKVQGTRYDIRFLEVRRVM